jgi:hypothetical protein
MVELGKSLDLESSETDLPNAQTDDFSEQQSKAVYRPQQVYKGKELSNRQSVQVTVKLT